MPLNGVWQVRTVHALDDWQLRVVGTLDTFGRTLVLTEGHESGQALFELEVTEREKYGRE